MFQLNAEVMLSRVDDEIVLLHGATGKYFGLNPVGSRFMELLLDSPTCDSAEQRAVAEYEAPEDQVRSDFGKLLQDLRSRGLVDEDSL